MTEQDKKYRCKKVFDFYIRAGYDPTMLPTSNWGTKFKLHKNLYDKARK